MPFPEFYFNFSNNRKLINRDYNNRSFHPPEILFNVMEGKRKENV